MTMPGNSTITKHSLLRHKKKQKWKTNEDKTNATFETEKRMKKNKNSGIALERSVGNYWGLLTFLLPPLSREAAPKSTAVQR